MSSVGGLGGEFSAGKKEMESRFPHGWEGRASICTTQVCLPTWLSRLRGRLRRCEIDDGALQVPQVPVCSSHLCGSDHNLFFQPTERLC